MIKNEDWIPVDKRLPKEGQEVLVTVEIDESYGRGTNVWRDIELVTFHNDSGYFNIDNDWDEGRRLSIIAWMEKPVPYCKKKKEIEK